VKRLFQVVLFFLPVCLAAQTPSDDISPGRQVITSSMLKAAGIINIAEIVTLADKVNYSTIDGFTKNISVNNLSDFRKQNCTFMIDGQKYDIGIFDNQNMNLLPVSVSQIDFVEIFTEPRVVDGTFIEGGLIHIHTKKPARGITAFANEIVGNETGDPGPYRYTDKATPNVDKIGPFYSVGINYGSKNWFAEASYKNEETFDTDPLIMKQVAFLNYNNFKTNLNSGWGALNINWPFGNTEISGGVTSHDEFFFLRQAGYEIPVARAFSQLGVNGRIKAEENISVKYSAAYSTNEMNKRENKIDFNFDLNVKKISGILEGVYSNSAAVFSAGLGFDRYEALSKRYIRQTEFERKSLFASLAVMPNKSFYQRIDFLYLKDRDFNSLKGSMANTWKMDSYNTLSSAFSYFEHNAGEDMSFRSWYERGYDIYKELKTEYVVIGSPEKNKTVTADIFYKIKPDSLLSVELSGGYRYFYNYNVEKQSFQYSEENSVFYAPVYLFPGEELKIISAGLTVNQKILPQLSHKLVYNYQNDISGTGNFRETWKVVPAHSLIYILDYQPVESFGIWAKIKYLSSSVWYDYKYANAQAGTDYNYEIAPRFSVDLSFQKWFFNRTLWVNLLLRNLFNRDEKYNPSGVNFALTDFFQVHFYFDSIPE
jgi:hypothetical protein